MMKIYYSNIEQNSGILKYSYTIASSNLTAAPSQSPHIYEQISLVEVVLPDQTLPDLLFMQSFTRRAVEFSSSLLEKM